MNIYRAIKEEMLVPVHPAGWPFIALFSAITVMVGLVFEPFFWIGIPASLWCVYFFRNPERVTPPDPLAVIAPADGRVLSVGEAELPPELDLPEGRWRCISIFMNVFDVHVNRSPIAGRVADSHYVKGAFVNASLDKANIDNERLALIFETDHASVPKIGCVQIAGLVARRILCDVDVGDKLAAGQVYGLIRFGSRVDIWLPASIDALVLPGQRTLAGETVLAKLPARAKKSASPAVVKTAKKPALKAAKKATKKAAKKA
ncbi:MAG: phosphatidylserine decarboxylase [Candidatus Puniceispirillaceae bacterium]